jgi:hypothetical protein
MLTYSHPFDLLCLQNEKNMQKVSIYVYFFCTFASWKERYFIINAIL